MLMYLLCIAAGVGLVCLIIIVAAVGLYGIVKVARQKLHEDQIARAKQLTELEVAQSVSRLVAGHVARLEQIGDRVSTISADTYLAELEVLYAKADVIAPQVTENTAKY